MNRLLHATLDVTAHARFCGLLSSSIDPPFSLGLLGCTLTVVVDGTSPQGKFPFLVSLVVGVTSQFVSLHVSPGVVTVHSHCAVKFVTSGNFVR